MCCCVGGWVAQETQVQMNAHFHAVHLFAVMTKLLPEWLPRTLFDLLHRQWLSPERRARSAAIPLLNPIHPHLRI